MLQVGRAVLAAVEESGAGPVFEDVEADPIDIADWRARYAPGLIGDHPALLRALRLAAQSADTSCAVLIVGETGTGKELFARAIHDASPRQANELVAVNCAAIPDTLMEAELFGYVKGAFTGAQSNRAGRFVSADGGTLMLDEIGDLPLALQAKLLRALQEKAIQPVGSDSTVAVDARVIAATHRDLDALAESGSFRHDLLYRLDVVRIELPALRERSEDIPVLVDHFIARSNQRHGRRVRGCTPELLDALIDYEWPGNLRQLENAIDRMVVVRGSGDLAFEDLPSRIAAALGQRGVSARATRSSVAPRAQQPAAVDAESVIPEGQTLREVVEAFERSLVERALAKTGQNKLRAAEMLGLNRTTLIEKMKRWRDGEPVVSLASRRATNPLPATTRGPGRTKAPQP